MQLRVVHDLPGRLRWLECACMDASIDPGVAGGSHGDPAQLDECVGVAPGGRLARGCVARACAAVALLVSRLTPWLPPPWAASARTLEPDGVLEELQLGIPDYLHPLLRQRFESLWLQFHQLRQLPLARLSLLSDPPRIDGARLLRLLQDPQLTSRPCPPAPAWVASRWSSPPSHRAREWYENSELTG